MKEILSELIELRYVDPKRGKVCLEVILHHLKDIDPRKKSFEKLESIIKHDIIPSAKKRAVNINHIIDDMKNDF